MIEISNLESEQVRVKPYSTLSPMLWMCYWIDLGYQPTTFTYNIVPRFQYMCAGYGRCNLPLAVWYVSNKLRLWGVWWSTKHTDTKVQWRAAIFRNAPKKINYQKHVWRITSNHGKCALNFLTREKGDTRFRCGRIVILTREMTKQGWWLVESSEWMKIY